MLHALALALLWPACDAASQAVWLTSIQPFTGGDWDAGISMRLGAQIMLEEVNANPILLPGYELKVAWQDGLCSKGAGTQLFLENVFNRKYQAFAPGKTLAELDADGDGRVTSADVASMTEIWNSSRVSPHPVGLLGSGCSGTALNIANVAFMARFPMISNSATRPGLSDRSAYPNFFRTIMPDTFFNAAWLSMARELGQSRVGVVIGEIENWGSMGTSLANAAMSLGVQLVGNDLTRDVANLYGMRVSLDSQSMAAAAAADLVAYKPRVVILLMFDRRNRLVLCEAHKSAFFNAVYMPMGWLSFGWWSVADTACTPTQLTSMAFGFISANMLFWRNDGGTRLSCSANMTAAQFQDEWFHRQGGTRGDMSMRPEGYAPAMEAATTADAVCMYAQMLHEVLINRGVPLSELTDRTETGYSNAFDVLSNTDFEGVQGRVRFQPGNPDPLGSVILQQLQSDAGGQLRLLDVGVYNHPAVTFLGHGNLTFQFPGESFFAGPSGATSLKASLTSFRSCTDKVLDMRSNVCVDCAANTQYVQAASGCLCVAGFYETASGCSPCPPGTISKSPGTLKCTACGLGKFAPSGRTSCTFCPRGRFSDALGLGACHSCPQLRTTADIASESATACICDTGAYRNGSSSGCTACPLNASTNGLNSPSLSSCLCPGNTYMEDNSLCRACPAGSATRGSGKTSISHCLCERNLYLSNGVCQACPAGSTTVGDGKTSISQCLCERDTYLSGGTCRACPAGSRTTSHGKTSVRSCLCDKGTYMTSALRCTACPKGMVCPKGSSEDNARYIAVSPKTEEQMFLQLAPRFWASLEQPMSVFECRSAHKCPGGRFPGSACAEFLTAQACEHCQAGYIWSGSKCDACARIGADIFLFLVLPIFLAPVIVIAMYKMFGDAFPKWNNWRNGVAVVAFLVLNYVQIVDCLRTANVRMPSAIQDTFGIWAFTNDFAVVVKLDCMGMGDFKSSIVMRGVFPLIMGAFCVLTFGVASALARFTRKPWLAMQRDRLLNVFGSLMFTFFNTIAVLCFMLFKCSRNPNGTQSLNIDLSVACWDSADWQSMLAICVVFVLVYIVGMGGLFVWAVIVAPKHWGDPGFEMRWKFLFIKFRSTAYWWSIVFLLKNVLINLAFVMTSTGILQLVLFMFIVTAYMAATTLNTPYRHRVVNALDIVATLSLMYIAALMQWYVDRSVDWGSSSTFVDATVGCICFLPVVVAIACLTHLASSGSSFPHTEKERTVATNEFEELERCLKSIIALQPEDGSGMLLEMAEWDRHYLKQAVHAIRVDFFGENSWARVPNRHLSQRFSEAMRKGPLMSRLSNLSDRSSQAIPAATTDVEDARSSNLSDRSWQALPAATTHVEDSARMSSTSPETAASSSEHGSSEPKQPNSKFRGDVDQLQANLADDAGGRGSRGSLRRQSNNVQEVVVAADDGLLHRAHCPRDFITPKEFVEKI